MVWKHEQWNLVNTGYYKEVQERLELRCEGEWNEIQ